LRAYTSQTEERRVHFLEQPGFVGAEHHGGVVAEEEFAIAIERSGQSAIVGALDAAGEFQTAWMVSATSRPSFQNMTPPKPVTAVGKLFENPGHVSKW